MINKKQTKKEWYNNPKEIEWVFAPENHQWMLITDNGKKSNKFIGVVKK